MSDEARRFAAEHAHYAEDLPFWRAPRRPPGLARCSTWAAPPAGWRSRSRATGTRCGRSTARPRCSPSWRGASPARTRTWPRGSTRSQGELQASPSAAASALVMVAMNTLQVLTDPADRLAACAAVRDHLAPGGRADLRRRPARRRGDRGRRWASSAPAGSTATRRRGEVLTHSAWYDGWDPATHTLAFTLRIRTRDGGGPGRARRCGRHRVHLFTPDELAGLLAEAGLEQIEVSGGFDGRAAPRRRRAPGAPLPGGRVSLPALRLGHLYPAEMNIYADRGNIAVLRQRLAWRGPGAGGDRPGDRRPGRAGRPRPLLPRRRPGPRPGRGGRGPRRHEGRGPARRRRRRRRRALRVRRASSSRGTATPAPTARGCRASGSSTSTPSPGPTRLIGNLVIDAEIDGEAVRVVGFENHAGRTRLGPGARPLGRVVSGHGNNGDDGVRGRRPRTASSAPTSTARCCRRTPAWPTSSSRWALEHRTGERPDLAPLDDSLEAAAHAAAVARATSRR